LDEPTLGLDVQTRTATWNYIKLLKKEFGMTIFMTTHYLEEADMLCDRVAIIDRGKIIATGAPNDLKESLGGDIMTLSIQDGEEDVSDIIKKVPNVKEVKAPVERSQARGSGGETCRGAEEASGKTREAEESPKESCAREAEAAKGQKRQADRRLADHR
jgi:ABC-type multidrug transport system ATPase subunit